MEKFKKTMRREDGFTLVELLAVIVILGIILAIAIPAIGNVISKSDTKAKAAEYDLVIDAARLYFTTDEGRSNTDGKITVGGLIDAGYLEEPASGEFTLVEKTSEVKREIANTGKIS